VLSTPIQCQVAVKRYQLVECTRHIGHRASTELKAGEESAELKARGVGGREGENVVACNGR